MLSHGLMEYLHPAFQHRLRRNSREKQAVQLRRRGNCRAVRSLSRGRWGALRLGKACLPDCDAITQTPAALTGALLKSHSKASPNTSLSSFYLFDAIARNTLSLAKKGAKSSRPERQERGKIAQAWLENAAGVADEIAATTFAQVSPSQQVRTMPWSSTLSAIANIDSLHELAGEGQESCRYLDQVGSFPGRSSGWDSRANPVHTIIFSAQRSA